MINEELLNILCCPETHQPLTLADKSIIEKLNLAIKEGKLKNRSGEIVKEKLDGGLIRQDKKYLYPIRNGIPIMLIEESISIE